MGTIMGSNNYNYLLHVICKLRMYNYSYIKTCITIINDNIIIFKLQNSYLENDLKTCSNGIEEIVFLIITYF